MDEEVREVEVMIERRNDIMWCLNVDMRDLGGWNGRGALWRFI